jgi:glycosyltransferase involved in cell wall biosynthesis
VYTGVRTSCRIGFVLTELVGGGAERSMLSLIASIDRARFAPSLVLFDERLEHEVPPGVPLHVLPRRGPGGLGRMTTRVFALADLAQRERFDLLVSFLTGPNIVATLAARRAGIPVVIAERSAPRTALSAANAQLRTPWLWRRLVRQVYPLATHLLTNTGGAKRELVSDFRIDSDAITVIPNAIDLARIRELAAAPLDDKAVPLDRPLVVHVGRFSYAKDHETLLRAFAQVRAATPAALVLVGGGEDETRVRDLAASLGLDRDVVFTGFTRNPYRYLARATVLVLTSRFEGLPNALLEAMALGIPIVSTACEYGPVELLQAGGGGVLVPVGDATAVGGAILALLSDPARRAALGAEGLARVAAFDQTRIAREYEALFLKSTHATST